MESTIWDRDAICLAAPAERKLIRYCLLELRNKLAAEGFDMEDVDAVIERLYI